MAYLPGCSLLLMDIIPSLKHLNLSKNIFWGSVLYQEPCYKSTSVSPTFFPSLKQHFTLTQTQYTCCSSITSITKLAMQLEYDYVKIPRNNNTFWYRFLSV